MQIGEGRTETAAVGEKESEVLGWWGWEGRLSAADFSISVALAVTLICGSTRASGEQRNVL